MMKIYADTDKNHFEFELNDANGQSFLTSAGKKLNISFQEKGSNRYLLIQDNHTYNINVDTNEQGFEVWVDGLPFQVQVLDEHTKKMREVIKSQHVGQTVKTIMAQIPGLIVKVMVKKGTMVKNGEPLLILEAMKMENVIKAPCDGQVQEVLVSAKETTRQGQLLLKIKPV